MPYPANTITPGVPSQPIPPAGGGTIRTKPQYTQEEIRLRTEAALQVVQQEGLPDLVQRCRSGTDADKEKAAALLSFIATHDQGCACMIVSAGGIDPLVAMLHADAGRGDEDPTLDMKEQACKTIRDLCHGDPGSTSRPIAERGGIPPLIDIISESSHPWSIREAAAEALALLAYETSGGPAQEIITEMDGVYKLLACYRTAGCTPLCKVEIAKALRYLTVYDMAKQQMRHLGILQPRETDPDSDGFEEVDAILMGATLPPA